MVCYASDVAGGEKARKALVAYLKKQGARPAVLNVPPAADGTSQTLAGWISSEGAKAVSAAIEAIRANPIPEFWGRLIPQQRRLDQPSNELAFSSVRHHFEIKCGYVRALHREGPANYLLRPL